METFSGNVNYFEEVLFASGVTTFLEVATWVGISLLIFDTLDYLTRDKVTAFIERNSWAGPLMGAIFGAIPGCGGAIMMVPLYNKRKISFGTLVASFIATFGDAAFIILVGRPDIFGWLFLIGFVVGIIVGYFLDIPPIKRWIDSKLDKKYKWEQRAIDKEKERNSKLRMPGRSYVFIDTKVMPILLTITVIGLFPATIMDIVYASRDADPVGSAGVYMEVMEWTGFVLTLFFSLYYFGTQIANRYVLDPSECDCDNKSKGKYIDVLHHMFENLIEIITWVFIGSLIFETIFAYAEDGFNKFIGMGQGSMAVLIGVLIGMIPGCGPQIAFARVALATASGGGALAVGMFAALTANSINQDGDAGFALFAKDKKAAVWMRIFNAIPALIVGYILVGMSAAGVRLPA